MAMKPCRECGTEVSTKAKTCPHCGVDHPADKVKAAGASMQKIGCALTLLITLPILLMMCVAM